jgi:tetratricopeptide (TPR) repeat protein
MTTAALRLARSLAAAGRDEAARQAYLAVLRQDPDQVAALVEFGVLAETGGYRSAARSAYQRAVIIDADHAVARTGLANALRDSGKLTAARDHYRAALRCDPDFTAAHRGLAGVLSALGDPSAEAHWRAGYAGQTAIVRRYRGSGLATNLLLLFAARGGNVETGPWIDDRRYAVTALCADYHDPEAPLPPHDLIVNAIGDADLCTDALANAERIIARSTAPAGSLDDAHRKRRAPGCDPGRRYPTYRRHFSPSG